MTFFGSVVFIVDSVDKGVASQVRRAKNKAKIVEKGGEMKTKIEKKKGK